MNEQPPSVPGVAYLENLPADREQSLFDTSLTRPHVGSHDLLVDVRAVSVNPVDVKLRAHSSANGKPRVLGFDAAGVVVETGADVTLFAVGDEVYYAGTLDRAGSNAALQAVDERIVGAKPSTLSFGDAAALPLTTLTAWEALFDKLQLTSTSEGTLVIVAGAGGVASIMIQLTKVLAPNVRVIATASRPESETWVRGLGADEVVNHHGDLAEQLLALEPGGVEWIFTSSSSRPGALDSYVKASKPFGQIVAIDDPSTLDVVSLKSKAMSWHWEFMFARSSYQTADMIQQHHILNSVADLIDKGLIRSTASTTFSPINAEQLRAAHVLVESGRVVGKVVVAQQ